MYMACTYYIIIAPSSRKRENYRLTARDKTDDLQLSVMAIIVMVIIIKSHSKKTNHSRTRDFSRYMYYYYRMGTAAAAAAAAKLLEYRNSRGPLKNYCHRHTAPPHL